MLHDKRQELRSGRKFRSNRAGGSIDEKVHQAGSSVGGEEAWDNRILYISVSDLTSDFRVYIKRLEMYHKSIGILFGSS